MRRHDAPRPIRFPREIIDWINGQPGQVALEALRSREGWRLVALDTSEAVQVIRLPSRRKLNASG